MQCCVEIKIFVIQKIFDVMSEPYFYIYLNRDFEGLSLIAKLYKTRLTNEKYLSNRTFPQVYINVTPLHFSEF